MSCTPEALTKGREVWWVKTGDMKYPEDSDWSLRHGVVTGGGSSLVIVRWDEPVNEYRDSRTTREAKLQLADRVSLSEREAWEEAAGYLAGVRRELSAQLLLAHDASRRIEERLSSLAWAKRAPRPSAAV